jgi:hypothetical protein
MEEPMKSPNCRAAFHQMMQSCDLYVMPKFSPPRPPLLCHLFSRSLRPSLWKQLATVGRKWMESSLLDLITFFSRESQPCELLPYRLTTDTFIFLSRQHNDCLGHGETVTATFKR